MWNNNKIKRLEERIKKLESKVDLKVDLYVPFYGYSKYVPVNNMMSLLMDYFKLKFKSIPSHDFIEKKEVPNDGSIVT